MAVLETLVASARGVGAGALARPQRVKQGTVFHILRNIAQECVLTDKLSYDGSQSRH